MFETILMPVDGTPLSFKPLGTVIDLAKLSGSKVVVLSVAEPRLFRANDLASRESGKAAEAINLEAARQNVQKVRSQVEQAGVPCEGIVSMSPLPQDVILEAVRQVNCSLIVMATRGKLGAIQTLLSESTTQEVIRQSPVPVLVFP